MIKYLLFTSYWISMMASAHTSKHITEITRYELGNWECSSSITVKDKKIIFNSCKWGKDNCTVITDPKVIDFIYSIDEKTIQKAQKEAASRYYIKKLHCGVSKMECLFVIDGKRYSIKEVICPDNETLTQRVKALFLALEQQQKPEHKK